jgi:hypothetical protein
MIVAMLSFYQLRKERRKSSDVLYQNDARQMSLDLYFRARKEAEFNNNNKYKPLKKSNSI